MPIAITIEPPVAVPQQPPRKKWTRDECLFLERSGLFDGQKYELVDGELINKMAMDRPHVVSIVLTTAWLSEVFEATRVQAQGPINVAPEDNPTSLPQPDLCVLSCSARDLDLDHPAPTDVVLVIEVADSSFDFDSTTKAGLYARAGIGDYWILDVRGRRIVVHREPHGGRYTSVTSFGEHEQAYPLAAPGSGVTAGELLARGA